MGDDLYEAGASEQMLRLAANIVSAYVATHVIPAERMPDLIREVYHSLNSLRTVPEEPSVPAVPLRRSVFNDHLVCLEDGLSMKMLKRHLLTVHQMTPADYRAKWGLPPDYPMVAPDYARVRSELAKRSGLGKKPEDRGRATRSGSRGHR
jgi:predicted transcriptional regulator